MVKKRFLAIFVLLVGLFAGYFAAASFLGGDSLLARVPFRLGLDLRGGAHLVYRADVSGISTGEVSSAMVGLRDVIERRVNMFGVTEPVVQVEKSRGEERLIVELPGVKDINEAINLIGKTPFLEFKEQRSREETQSILDAQKKNKRLNEDPYFKSTGLTGRFLQKAQLNFNRTTFKPEISLSFNDKGAEIFAELTRKNIGKPLAIYLDGAPISVPTVKEEISSGRAQITGDFTPEKAKQLVRDLNTGALPVPIKLISQQTIGASLGENTLLKSIYAGIAGFLAVAFFLIILYRFLGFLAVVALLIYAAVVLSLFKLIPVTLTSAGIAGFVLSIGVAVDANILIFERMKEELREQKSFNAAVADGFSRAWTSIRDSNFSTIITATILYWFSSSMIKGFALTLGIGVLISLFSSFFITRTLLVALGINPRSKFTRFLFLLSGS
jgi:protein-export membrane protein SecD